MGADKEKIYQWFSEQRFNKFLRHADDLKRAEELYKNNIRLSESLYPVLSVFEVSLRNAVHNRLGTYFGNEAWYEELRYYPDLKTIEERVLAGISEIGNRNEELNPGKVVAEMTLGFWVSLFNARYEKSLWKPLRLCFKHIEKSRRQRNVVSANLNKIRVLRNRIYHYEPICWDLNVLHDRYRLIIETLQWLDRDLPEWIDDIDDFETVLNAI